MPSSDVTAQKLGSDFDWLIVQTFAYLGLIMKNFSGLRAWHACVELENVDNLYRKQQNCPCLRKSLWRVGRFSI